MKYSGIVLAGGKSSRMGTDKSLLMINGKPMIQYSIDALKPLCQEIIIVSNGDHLNDLGYTVVPDTILDAGPVAGIHAGLSHAINEKCVVLSCDLPNIDSILLQQLLNVYQDETTLVSRCAAHLHPLVGIYQKSKAEELEQFLENGKRKLLDCLVALNACVHKFPDTMEQQFANINTPDEWKAWKEQ